MKLTTTEFNNRKETIKNKYEALRNKIYFTESGKIVNLTSEDHKKLNEIRSLESEELTNLNREYYNGIEIGDGVTYHLYSDAHACTVIKRTAKTITIQEDDAKLDDNFKPEWIAGGFAGHCTNQNKQTYTYKSNPNGMTLTARWNERRGCWICYDKIVTMGRHEFYDYNF